MYIHETYAHTWCLKIDKGMKIILQFTQVICMINSATQLILHNLYFERNASTYKVIYTDASTRTIDDQKVNIKNKSIKIIRIFNLCVAYRLS